MTAKNTNHARTASNYYFEIMNITETYELHLERECRQLARAHGWAAWKNEKNGNKGIPDDSFLHPDGRFFLIEFKKDEKQHPRPEQQLWLDRFPNNAFLVGSVKGFCDLLGITPQ